MTYKKADEDADCLIVKAIALDPIHPSVVVIAAHQHSLKVYYQIQQWLGNKKRPGDWGWERINSELQPEKTLKSPEPDSILYARYPATVRRGAQEIEAVGRSDCFVQCCILIVGATAITERFK
ncbi:hypothetical protein AVEN_41323-1 [Araneus ventricosus]|uniref:Uncharacterized protein n=1 Tax=Araneus ventricosus TaxID=182803 RepID=A0A4Y2VRB6_ARAVE|nr:hypothetical protein AVEN_41323-1 [Araneus ventricosus]